MTAKLDMDFVNATACDGVMIDTCVCLRDGAIIYAGPIRAAPSAANFNDVFLNPVNFAELEASVKRRRN